MDEARKDEAIEIATWAIYDALSVATGVGELETNRSFGETKADVYAVIRGIPVAIEVLCGRVSEGRLRRRTIGYSERGVFVLWVGVLRKWSELDGYRPSAWERWCHIAYGGRVYYWVADDEIQPVHFGPYKERVPRTTLCGAWGREYCQGGYERIAKVERKPAKGEVCRISTDFQGLRMEASESGGVKMPSRLVYSDVQMNWWQTTHG